MNTASPQCSVCGRWCPCPGLVLISSAELGMLWGQRQPGHPSWKLSPDPNTSPGQGSKPGNLPVYGQKPSRCSQKFSLTLHQVSFWIKWEKQKKEAALKAGFMQQVFNTCFSPVPFCPAQRALWPLAAGWCPRLTADVWAPNPLHLTPHLGNHSEVSWEIWHLELSKLTQRYRSCCHELGLWDDYTQHPWHESWLMPPRPWLRCLLNHLCPLPKLVIFLIIYYS